MYVIEMMNNEYQELLKPLLLPLTQKQKFADCMNYHSKLSNTNLSNTLTNFCMALLNFLLFYFLLYCYAFVQYCYLKSIPYNAMHKFV